MLVALVGPSGSGKSTLAEGLRGRHTSLTPLLSYTTRSKRQSDKLGEYQYVSDSVFNDMVQRQEFLWHVRPYKSPYRYGSRVYDVDAAISGDDSIAILTGSSLYTLYGYARRKEELEEVALLYLAIDNQVELRRRLLLDPSRTDIEERLAEAPVENREARASYLPYQFIDATLPKEQVLAEALRILDTQ